MNGLLAAGRRHQRLHGEQPADVGHQQHDDVDDVATTRSTSASTTGGGGCSATSPTGSSARFTFSGGFTGNPVADMLLGYYSGAASSSPRRSACRASPAIRASSTSSTSRRTSRTTGRCSSSLTLNLGLRWDYRNAPYETNNRMGWRNLERARRHVRRRPDRSCTRGIVGDGSFYQYCGRRNPKDPIDSRSSRRGSASRGGRSTTSARSCAAATASSSTRPKAARSTASADIYPYVSRGNYPQSIGQLDAAADDATRCSRASAAPGVATPAANSFLAVSHLAEPEGPVRAAVVARRAAAIDRATRRSS